MIHVNLLNGVVINTDDDKDFFNAVKEQLREETFTPKYWFTEDCIVPFSSIAFIQFEDKDGK